MDSYLYDKILDYVKEANDDEKLTRILLDAMNIEKVVRTEDPIAIKYIAVNYNSICSLQSRYIVGIYFYFDLLRNKYFDNFYKLLNKRQQESFFKKIRLFIDRGYGNDAYTYYMMKHIVKNSKLLVNDFPEINDF